METSVFLNFCYNYRLGEIEQVLNDAFGENLSMHFVDKWIGASKSKGGTAALIDTFMQMSEGNREKFVNQVLKLKSK